MGYVHSMTHQLGAVYHPPYCVCCALPVVERDRAKRLPATFRNIVKDLELHTEGMTRYQVFGLRNR